MALAPTPRIRWQGLLAMSLLASVFVAEAQSLAYTAKELKRPTGYGVSACDHPMDAALSDNGDVSSLCAYRSGFFFDPSIGFGLIPLPRTAFRPVIWRNGGAPVLPAMASGTEVKVIVGVDGRGRVLGRVGPIPSSKVTYDAKRETLNWWEGSQRSSWKSPVLDLAYNWAVSNVTHSGQFAAMTNSGATGPRVIVVNGSTVRDVPLPPGVGVSPGQQALLVSLYERNLVMNDKGQIALRTVVISTNSANEAPQAWFWNGSQWGQIPTGGRSLIVQDINASGVVHLTGMPYIDNDTRLRRYLWQEGGDLSMVSDEAYGSFSRPQSSVADNGDIVGVAVLPTVSSLPNIGQQRAVVWRNGQGLDLNSLNTPPSGHTYLSVLAENAKGQLLVRSLNTASSSTSTPRWWLLTPK
jgi:hypothetical protein